MAFAASPVSPFGTRRLPKVSRRVSRPQAARSVRIAQQIRRAVAEHQARAEQQADAACLRRLVHAHHAGHGVAVGDADRGQPKHCGRGRQFLRPRGAAQEGEGAGDLKLGVRRYATGHANRPCMYQRGVSPLR